MIFLFLLLAIMFQTLTTYEVTLLNMSETLQSEWYSTQNDEDESTGHNKWSPMGNPFNFYVCRLDGGAQDNYLRSPYIPLPGVKFVYVEIEYRITPCTETRDGVERKNCAQFFHLYLKESDNPKDTGRVDEYNYKLANEEYKSIVPGAFETFVTSAVPVQLSGKKSGVYFAIRDQGACILIQNIYVKYRVCPQQTINAVRYDRTILDGRDAQVTGTCVNNATHPENEPPIVYCRTEDGGSWEEEFQKSNCFCDKGFELIDDVCRECESGYYKKDAGNKSPGCVKCPANSVSLPNYTYKCECLHGYQRQSETDVDQPCIEPPDPPTRGPDFDLKSSSKYSLTFAIPHLEPHLKYEVEVVRRSEEREMKTVEANYKIINTTLVISDLQPDQTYLIIVIVANGSVKSEPVNFVVKTDSEVDKVMVLIIATGILGGVVLIIFMGCIVFICKRSRRRKKKNNALGDVWDPMLEASRKSTLGTLGTNQSNSLPHRKYVPLPKYADPQDALRNDRNLDPSHIALERVCGQGQFGQVWKGTYNVPGRKPKDIAAKVLKEGSNLDQKREFLMEAQIMDQFEDPNVIELIGVVNRCDQFMIITEYMRNGCLQSYLKEIKGKKLTLQLLSMARGIVSGMKYLAEMNFIHRDLAARNILVDEKGVCKVSDFGLSRMLEEDSQYYKSMCAQIPVRWTAPEAIVHQKYTQASDVYSMGVVLWEIFTYGDTPWGKATNDMVLNFLKQREKLPRPEACPVVVYDIMMKCWLDDYTQRPSFAALHLELDRIIVSSLDRNTPFPVNTLTSLTSSCSDEPLLTVSQWLRGLGLSQYEAHFMNTGWDKIDSVVQMSEKDLQNIGITLAGHVKKIKTAIDSINMCTMNTLHSYPGYTPDNSLNRNDNSIPRFNSLPLSHASSPCLPLGQHPGTMT